MCPFTFGKITMNAIVTTAGCIAIFIYVLHVVGMVEVFIEPRYQTDLGHVVILEKEYKRLKDYEYQCQNMAYNLQIAQIIRDGKNHEP